MYETHFGLACRPFAAAPSPDQYFAADSIESARQTLTRVVERAEGPALVVGPAGIGKSMLCQILASQLADRFQVANLASARLCTRRALLQNILFELKLPYRDLEEGELRLSLMDHLEPSRDRTEGLLLLVDEAQTLPFKLLEELRLITNLVRDGQPRVRLVLVGNASLEERFAHPKLNSFNQRLAARVFLTTLNSEETEGYIRSALTLAGGEQPGPFTDDALMAIHRTTGGVPRLINQLCDHSLIMAALGGVPQLDAAGIEEAWADLQQLPLPSATKNSFSEDVIEFGSLDDEPGERSDDSPGPFHVVADDEVADDEVSFEPHATFEPEDQSLNAVVELPSLEDEAEYVPLAEPDSESFAEETQEDQTAAVVIEATEEPVDPPEVVNSEDDSSPAADREPAQFEPLGLVESEVELVFQGKPEYVQLFGGTFEDEEVVVDRYASLEDQARRQPAVAAEETEAQPEPVGVVDDLGSAQPQPIRLAEIRDDASSIEVDADVDDAMDERVASEAADGFAWVARRTDVAAEADAGDSADNYVARPFDPADDPVLPESRFSAAQTQFDVFANRHDEPPVQPPRTIAKTPPPEISSPAVADAAVARRASAVSEEAIAAPAAHDTSPTTAISPTTKGEPDTKAPQHQPKRVFGQLFARLRHG